MPTTRHCEDAALVLIDLQHSNTGRTLAPHSTATVLANAARLAAAMRARGALVVYVRVLIDQIAQPEVDRKMPRPATIPENACELDPACGVQPGDLVVTKRQWGALYGTELDQALRRRGVRTIVLAGLATNFGVESTARAAYDRAYELVFIEDAMATLNEEMHRFATEQIFPLMGRVRTTDGWLGELG